MSLYMMVALGGALGAMARFALGKWLTASLSGVGLWSAFPWATFSINVIGSLAMGFAFVLLTEKITSWEAYRPLIMVGFLGGFTTFSTFSLEILSLINQQAWLSALSYLSLSCFCGVAGAALGIFLGRLL
ncbi:fluoride efflux transporter CrcB [Marinomonas agarivorans]|nr:fluoride efflux transporter CrcB [Marinomonas agarivorans]